MPSAGCPTRIRTWSRWAQALYEAYGAQRLFWASDYPWIAEDPGYAAMVELPGRLLPGLGEEERQALIGRDRRPVAVVTARVGRRHLANF